MKESCISSTVVAPSNIALVKYWGKKEGQIPCNPSISFTLTNSYTTTSLKIEEGLFNVAYQFEESCHQSFSLKVQKHIQNVSTTYPELQRYAYDFSSKNSFPHSCGIASSASSFAAIGLHLSNIIASPLDWTLASSLARVGSGSAARSLFGGAVLWGKLENLGSDYSAIPIAMNPYFEKINDTIFIVDPSEKSVSSTLGHAQMENHPYKEQRFKHAKEHAEEMVEVLISAKKERFIQIVEQEALDLHAMMMTSKTPFILMKPLSVEIISRVQNFRKKNNVFMAFTLDAGPNVHLFWHEEDAELVEPLLHDLSALVNGRVIRDLVSLTGSRFL